MSKICRGWVTRALWEERTLVKTAMRGTLHLLPASELPEWHAALGTRKRHRGAPGWQRFLGISIEELDRLTSHRNCARWPHPHARAVVGGSRPPYRIEGIGQENGSQYLGHSFQAGRVRREPVLREEPVATRALHPSGDLAGGCSGACRSAGRQPCDRSPLPRGLRSCHGSRPLALVGRRQL